MSEKTDVSTNSKMPLDAVRPSAIKRQRGMTLIELVLVIAVMAGLIAGAITLYSATRASNNSAQMLKDVVAIQAGVSSIYTGQRNYDGLDNSVLYNAKRVPSSMKYDDGTIYTTEGGTLTVAGEGTSYTVTLSDVSSSSCISMVSSLSSGFTGVSVDGTALASSIADFPVAASAASAACGADKTVAIVYTGGTGS